VVFWCVVWSSSDVFCSGSEKDPSIRLHFDSVRLLFRLTRCTPNRLSLHRHRTCLRDGAQEPTPG
jgi:hypothetical protein